MDIPIPILNNKSSYVQILISLDNANATKSSSFVCLSNNSLALGINDLYSSNGEKVILFNIKKENLSNLSFESFDFFNISCLCLINSSLSLCLN